MWKKLVGNLVGWVVELNVLWLVIMFMCRLVMCLSFVHILVFMR